MLSSICADAIGIDAETIGAHERLSAELEQDSLIEGLLEFDGLDCFFLLIRLDQVAWHQLQPPSGIGAGDGSRNLETSPVLSRLPYSPTLKRAKRRTEIFSWIVAILDFTYSSTVWSRFLTKGCS